MMVQCLIVNSCLSELETAWHKTYFHYILFLVKYLFFSGDVRNGPQLRSQGLKFEMASS